jgi:hypothetical protein
MAGTVPGHERGNDGAEHSIVSTGEPLGPTETAEEG